ncbi:MAG: ATP-binding cassette domain-containing protein [Ectothiorhodospiraceae bacterium]|nr:ATP-binding cassette domain-containing protein [Ectothiorhodospiraceae bacterium]
MTAASAPVPNRLAIHDLDCGTLRRVSLTVEPGEIVCLSGPSGSGKTRLLRAIADLDAHGGEVMLGGSNQQRTPAHCWRGWVMLVPAESQWWAETVREHCLDLSEADLAALGFGPEVMDWSVSRLSSGEKQRLAVLRALSHQPEALLLDEPTANLDGDSTRRMESWLRERIRRERLPVIWVAHDPGQIARVADRHFRIDGEQLREAPCR